MQLRWEDARYEDKPAVSAISGAVRQHALEELNSKLASEAVALASGMVMCRDGPCVKVVGQRTEASVKARARHAFCCSVRGAARALRLTLRRSRVRGCLQR